MRIIGDTNGDGTPDIAVGSGRWEGMGADFHIMDGKTGEQLELIQYEEQTEFSDWNMAQPVLGISVVSDITGDGIEDMMVRRTAQIDEEEIVVLEFVDIETGTLLRQVPVGHAIAEDNGDVNSDGKADVLVSQGNSLYCLDGSYSLSILSPENGDTIDDEFTIKWDPKGVECEVFIDGISYGSYSEGEATLTISGGEHEIIVETTDEFGGILSDSIIIDVPKSNAPLILNIIVGTILVILVVLVLVMRRAKLQKSADDWREKRREIEAAKSVRGEKNKETGKKKKKDQPAERRGKKRRKKADKKKTIGKEKDGDRREGSESDKDEEDEIPDEDEDIGDWFEEEDLDDPDEGWWVDEEVEK